MRKTRQNNIEEQEGRFTWPLRRDRAAYSFGVPHPYTAADQPTRPLRSPTPAANANT